MWAAAAHSLPTPPTESTGDQPSYPTRQCRCASTATGSPTVGTGSSTVASSVASDPTSVWERSAWGLAAWAPCSCPTTSPNQTSPTGSHWTLRSEGGVSSYGTLAARPMTTHGSGTLSEGPSTPATSCAGSSPTPATHRRCSATQWNGQPPCARCSTSGRTGSIRPMAYPSWDAAESKRSWARWPKLWSTWPTPPWP